MKKQNLKLLVIVICVLAAGICYHYSRQTGRAQGGGQVLEFSEETEAKAKTQNVSNEIQSDTGLRYEDAADSELETGAKPAVPFTERTSFYVHVCGEVNAPGVYEMEQGDRLFQAIERAGGFTQEAAEGYLNLAQEVVDGMKVVVPSKDWEDSRILTETAQEESGQLRKGSLDGFQEPGLYMPVTGESAPGKLNLNTATKEELMTLKGVGQARAEDIIAYRETHGQFQAIEEIMNIPGIKEGAFEKIKEDITV